MKGFCAVNTGFYRIRIRLGYQCFHLGLGPEGYFSAELAPDAIHNIALMLSLKIEIGLDRALVLVR